MAKKSTKYRRKSVIPRSRKRRNQEQMVTKVIYGFLALCVVMFAGIGITNSTGGRPASMEWIVPDVQMEILAEPAVMDRGSSGENQNMLPFMPPMATERPAETELPALAPEATLVTLPTPVPAAVTAEPTSAPTAEPTEQPELPAMQPEEPLSYVPITITAVGDCTLGGDVKSGGYRNFENYAEKYGPDYFFKKVRALFESDDLTIVNLEGPLTDSDDMRSGRTFNFRGHPEYVKILSGSSVEIANVANNHALDFGDDGFNETAEVLKSAGIGVSGFSLAYGTEVKGVKVGSLGFTEWAYSEEQIKKTISNARKKCDLLIVSIHWGEEKEYAPLRSQEKLGRAMIDAGADLVIGNHSHVYGGVEQYKGKYIIYSLGNFCFGGNKNPGDKNCTIFQQTFNVNLSAGTVSDGGINIIPARVSGSNDKNDFQPYILSGEAAQKQLKKIAEVSSVDSSKLIWMDKESSPVGAVALNRSL